MPNDAAALLDRRADFHDFGPVTYLDCATQGPMPRVATAAVEAALDLKRAPYRIRDEDYFLYPDRYREAVARLLGASPAEVAVTDSATAGIMLLVNGLDWRAGDEVVIPARAFPANRLPWFSLARHGVRVVAVPEVLDGREVERYASALSPHTRVMSVSWVSHGSGLRSDLLRLGDLCRERGILFSVDATQGFGGLGFDLRETPCDLLACAGYKWMLGPYGLSFAWVSPALTDRLALGNINWLAARGAEDFNRFADSALDLVPNARRFDRNEAASFLDTAGAIASAHYLLEVTPRAIEAHVRALQDRLVAGLPAGFRAASALAPSLRSNLLSIAAATPEATRGAYDRLVAAGVRVGLREGAIRFSPHVYNTAAEIDRVLERLEG